MSHKKLTQGRCELRGKLIAGFAVIIVVAVVIAAFAFFQGDERPRWEGGTYIDPDGLFSFEAPEGWVIEEFEKDLRSKVSFVSPEGDKAITIIVEPFLYGTTVTEEEKERIRSGLIKRGYDISEYYVTVDGVEGWVVEYEEASENMGIRGAAFVKNGNWHSISFAYSLYASEDGFWDQMLSSFASLGG